MRGGALQAYCSEIRIRPEQNLYVLMEALSQALCERRLSACHAFNPRDDRFLVGNSPPLQGAPVLMRRRSDCRNLSGNPSESRFNRVEVEQQG